MALPSSVRIVEVSPRDGLQNEKTMVSTADKIELVNHLSACGLQTVEAASLFKAFGTLDSDLILETFKVNKSKVDINEESIVEGLQVIR